MGKIRVKTLGDKDKEKKQKERDEARREGKKTAKLKGKGGGRIAEMEGTELPKQAEEIEAAKTTTEEKKEKFVSKHIRSKSYLKARGFIDKTKNYPLEEALNLIRKTNLAKFDATVEVHINTIEKGIKGSVSLPHGVGRQFKIAIVNDEIITEIEKGKTNFDVLIAHPSFMPKLAKLAKILGPKGLMPNPKNGTISENPQEAAKKFAGTLQFKTENEFPILHTVIGKMSFDNQKLIENFLALIKAVDALKIKNVFIKSSMSPSVKVEIQA